MLKAPVATLDQLQLHVTTVGPHQKAHEAHKHPEEELIIVKEGMIDAMQNGETTRVGPGSVIFEASNELHGLAERGRHAGDVLCDQVVLAGDACHKDKLESLSRAL